MAIGVIVFPGSNCDHDVYHVIKHVCGADARFIWHKDQDYAGVDALVLPGGFSYGDYLRPGAIARVSPAMAEVKRFVTQGRPVLGICNGFQILVESGILPGALVRNRDQRFICKPMPLRVETTDSPYTAGFAKGQVVNFPVAHADGNYEALPDTIKELEDNDRVAFRYAAEDGTVDEGSNPNGSMNNIAGLLNPGRNVLGLMPHPERVTEDVLGGTDGRALFEGMIKKLVEQGA